MRRPAWTMLFLWDIAENGLATPQLIQDAWHPEFGQKLSAALF